MIKIENTVALLTNKNVGDRTSKKGQKEDTTKTKEFAKILDNIGRIDKFNNKENKDIKQNNEEYILENIFFNEDVEDMEIENFDDLDSFIEINGLETPVELSLQDTSPQDVKKVKTNLEPKSQKDQLLNIKSIKSDEGKKENTFKGLEVESDIEKKSKETIKDVDAKILKKPGIENKSSKKPYVFKDFIKKENLEASDVDNKEKTRASNKLDQNESKKGLKAKINPEIKKSFGENSERLDANKELKNLFRGEAKEYKKSEIENIKKEKTDILTENEKTKENEKKIEIKPELKKTSEKIVIKDANVENVEQNINSIKEDTKLNETNKQSEPFKVQKEIVNQLAEKIDYESLKDKDIIKVKLKPEYLGEVEIKVEKTREGYKINFIIENQETKQLIGSNIKELESKFLEKGFSGSEFSFNDSSKYQNQQRQNNRRFRSNYRNVFSNENVEVKKKDIRLGTQNINYYV